MGIKLNVKLFKNLQKTVWQYELNRLEPFYEILKDQVEALDKNVKLHPESDRLQTMFHIKFEELQILSANVEELKRKLAS